MSKNSCTDAEITCVNIFTVKHHGKTEFYIERMVVGLSSRDEEHFSVSFNGENFSEDPPLL